MMKKLTLFLTVLAVTIGSAKAQFEIKALVGTNFSSIKGNNDAEVKANAGYQFGGGVLIGDKFYVEPGIQFGKMSSTFTTNSNSEDIKFDQNFVRIPVYAGYHLLGAEDKPLALRVFAGPAVTIPGKISKGPEGLTKEDVSKALWGVDGGLGLDIFFLFVEVNYEHSFTDHFVDGTAGKHNSVYLNAGVHFDF